MTFEHVKGTVVLLAYTLHDQVFWSYAFMDLNLVTLYPDAIQKKQNKMNVHFHNDYGVYKINIIFQIIC